MKITISINPDLNNWLDNYCKSLGYKKSTYITFLIERTKMERESIGTSGSMRSVVELSELDGQGGGMSWDAKPQKVSKKASKPKKQLCPHGIDTNGYCARCIG